MAELRAPHPLERQLFVELVQQFKQPGEVDGPGLRRLRAELRRFGYKATSKGLMIEREEDVDFDDASVMEFIDLMKRIGSVPKNRGWDKADR